MNNSLKYYKTLFIDISVDDFVDSATTTVYNVVHISSVDDPVDNVDMDESVLVKTNLSTLV